MLIASGEGVPIIGKGQKTGPLILLVMMHFGFTVMLVQII
jgi:hypothetical protein